MPRSRKWFVIPVLALSASWANAGDLTIKGNLIANSNLAVSGNVGIGTTTPGAKLHVAGDFKRGGVKYFDLARQIGPDVGDFVTLGQIANTAGNYVKIHIAGDFMCGMVCGDFILNRLKYTENTTSWVELPMLPGVTYGGKAVVVDARCTSSSGGYTELRVRRKGAACLGVGDLSFGASIETDGEYVEQNTTGTGAEVAPGYLAFDSWQFPVAASSPFQASTEGLFIQPNGSVGIGTPTPTSISKLDVMPGVATTNNTTIRAGLNIGYAWHLLNAAFYVPETTLSAVGPGDLRTRTFGLYIPKIEATNNHLLVGNQNGDDSGQIAGIRIDRIAASAIDGYDHDWSNYGIWIKELAGGVGTRHQYGLKIDKVAGAAENNYGVYIAGGDKNYFATNVGIGVGAPLAMLHVNGSTRVDGDAVFNGSVEAPNLYVAARGDLSMGVYTNGPH